MTVTVVRRFIILSKQIQLRRRGEVLELLAVLGTAGALADGAFGGEFAVFEIAEDDFGALQEVLRHAGEAGNVGLALQALDGT